MLVGISEAICVLFNNFPLSFYIFSNVPLIATKNDLENPQKFTQWLAGLIDGDGCFLLSKKGFASLEITVDIRDKHALFLIKQKYGGSVKLRSGAKAMRYRLHHKEGLLKLINDLNGHLRNSIRILQFSKICEKYNIPLLFCQSLTYYNAWFSGFFDSDGSIYLSPDGIIISASNNNKSLLDELINIYGGKIYLTNTTGRSFKWILINKIDIIYMIQYFKICPSFTNKMNRIRLINQYFELKKNKAHLATTDSINGKLWIRFKNKWDKYE